MGMSQLHDGEGERITRQSDVGAIAFRCRVLIKP